MLCLSAALVVFSAAPNFVEFQKLCDEQKVSYLNQHIEQETLSVYQTTAAQRADWSTREAALARNIEFIWGDTILEGDYGVYGPISSLVQSVGTSEGQQTFAYTIEVSRPAVRIAGDDCHFDKVTNVYSGTQCVFGTISETHFIDLQFSDLGPTANGFVQFY